MSLCPVDFKQCQCDGTPDSPCLAVEALRKDADRWRWWRNRWPALCRMEVARFAGLDLTRTYVQSPEDMDAVTDAAMQAP